MHEDSHQDEWSLETLAIRAGHHRTFEQEHSEPIFPTSSFVYESAAEAARKFGGKEPGNVYSRFTNPTVHTFERRLAIRVLQRTAMAHAQHEGRLL